MIQSVEKTITKDSYKFRVYLAAFPCSLVVLSRTIVTTKGFDNATGMVGCVRLYSACNNESTAGADASVEVPKLHNIKLAFKRSQELIFCMRIVGNDQP